MTKSFQIPKEKREVRLRLMRQASRLKKFMEDGGPGILIANEIAGILGSAEALFPNEMRDAINTRAEEASRLAHGLCFVCGEAAEGTLCKECLAKTQAAISGSIDCFSCS